MVLLYPTSPAHTVPNKATATTNGSSLGPQDLNELFVFFQNCEREYQAAIIDHSSAFGASILALVEVFSVLLRRDTIQRLRGTKRALSHLMHAVVMAVLTLAYFLPIAIKQSQYSTLPDLKADILLNDLLQAYVPFWSPSGTSQVIFSVTHWLTDCVLFYCLFVIWRSNWMVLVLFWPALLAVIVIDFLKLPIAVLPAFAYESLAFCIILARLAQSRKKGVDRNQILLVIVVGSGLFCLFRALWVASYWGSGGYNIWGNPMASSACVGSYTPSICGQKMSDMTILQIVIQCFGVARFARRQPVRSDESISTLPLASRVGVLA